MNDTPPLQPDAPTARHWLERELSKNEYHPHESWLRRAARWLVEHLTSWNVGVGGARISGTLVAVVVLILVVGVLVVSLRRFRPTPRVTSSGTKGRAAIFDGEQFDADTYARQARDARSRDPRAALVAAFRAVAARADEQGLLTLTPHSTVADITTQVGQRLDQAGAGSAPAVADLHGSLARAGELFERVRYGNGDATTADVDLVIDLDDAVRATTPVDGAVAAQKGPR